MQALKQVVLSLLYPSVNNDRFGKIRLRREPLDVQLPQSRVLLLLPFFRASAIGRSF
jgi:hypothetical protein